MQSLFLLQLCLLFAGDRKLFMRLQAHRSLLVTLCRQVLSKDGTVLHNHGAVETPDNEWLQWVRGEAERRIVYFTWSEYIENVMCIPAKTGQWSNAYKAHYF